MIRNEANAMQMPSKCMIFLIFSIAPPMCSAALSAACAHTAASQAMCSAALSAACAHTPVNRFWGRYGGPREKASHPIICPRLRGERGTLPRASNTIFQSVLSFSGKASQKKPPSTGAARRGRPSPPPPKKTKRSSKIRFGYGRNAASSWVVRDRLPSATGDVFSGPWRRPSFFHTLPQ